MKMLIAHLSVPQAKETTTETKIQEDEEAENYKQNFNVSVQVRQRIHRVDSWIIIPLLIQSPSLSLKALKNLKMKKLYLSWVSFQRKKLDLSIYIFDETLIEQSFEETLLDESPYFYNFKYLFNDIGCIPFCKLKMLYNMMLVFEWFVACNF